MVAAPRTGPVRRIWRPAGVLGLAAGVVVFVSLVDPNEGGHYPTCPFLWATGYQCPGCGTLRVLHALGHGRLGEALGLNVMTVAMVPVLAFFWGRWALASWQGRPTRTKAGDPRLIWLLFAAVMVFWLVRNLPFGHVLAA
ncbi:DUF2752 domain-containing protein [Actinomadura parmotrematis]|uniref:DUF2752 domain-containing protein n=1 Tax=Actinomadura parmotrematis TaxID=2864039 RepID=A0ABS7G490_9ACTN|nr:DUF2752 domain-containing protein [Actinomadura parmotrematis]MBW8487537.1 DUF2752 domain-containing protein [Actinomadura parmotrematis]